MAIDLMAFFFKFFSRRSTNALTFEQRTKNRFCEPLKLCGIVVPIRTRLTNNSHGAETKYIDGPAASSPNQFIGRIKFYVQVSEKYFV